MKRLFLIVILIFVASFVFPLQNKAQVQEDLNVSATINPQPSDASVVLVADTVEGSSIARGEEVEFTIEFNVQPQSGFPMTIVASWEEGEIVGSPGNYVEAYDYVIGSASQGPDLSVPVVDLLNRTITWNLTNVSQGTSSYELTFSLRAKQSFLTSDLIEVYTNVDATYNTAIIPQDEYQLFIDPTLDEITPTPTYTPTPTNTPTPTPTDTPTPTPTYTPTPTLTYTPTPTSTLTPQPTATPTPNLTPRSILIPTSSVTASPTMTPTMTPVPQPPPAPAEPVQFEFRSVEILDITDATAFMTTTLSLDSTLRVPFGSCGETSFADALVFEDPDTYHEIRFSNLAPDTQYCFRLDATNSLLQTSISSDIFTFRTAQRGQSYSIGTIRTLWNSLQLNAQDTQNLLVPAGVPVVMSIEIENPQNITQLDGEFVHRSVLGASTMSRKNQQQVRFIEVGKGSYTAEIMTPQLKGGYAFTLRIKDSAGNYSKRLIPYSINTTSFLRVLNEDGNPVENAYITLERKEESTGNFVTFNQAFTLNQVEKAYFVPYATDSDGYLRIALPVGSYRAQVTTVGYEPQEITFQIDDASTAYETVTLKSAFSFQSMLQYMNMTVKMGYERFIFDANQYFSTRILLSLAIIIQLVMLVGVVGFILLKIGVVDRIHSRVAILMRDLEEELFELFLGIWALINIGFSIMFILFQGFLSSLPIILMTVTVVVANILLFLWKEKHVLHKVE